MDALPFLFLLTAEGDANAEVPADADTAVDADVEELLILAEPARGTLEIDGLLDEPSWTQAAAVSFDDTTGVSDNTTIARVLWDLDALYIGFDITDADLRTGGGDIWNDDGVEIFIDTLLDGGETRRVDDVQVIVTIVGQAYFIHGGHIPFPETVAYGQWVGEAGYSLEIRVDWEELQVVPVTGLRMGLDLVNDDLDVEEERHAYDWAVITDTDYHNPDAWGVLELSGVPEPPVDGGPDAGPTHDADVDGASDAVDGDVDEPPSSGCGCSVAHHGASTATLWRLAP